MTDLGRKAIVVGISGASSSGKTTLSRLLRDIFPNTFVLHEDDFYKPEKDTLLCVLMFRSLPVKEDLLDWDCAEALVIPDIEKSLDFIQKNGKFPPDFDSKEDRNSIGECPVPDSIIAELKAEVTAWTRPGSPGHAISNLNPSPLRVCIFDGFLLYSPSMASIQKHMDIKFFLRVSYAKAKTRREARSGYATLEGFWEDPPGYVDKIVWPNYVLEHEWLFENGDVEAELKEDVLNKWKINAQVHKGPDVGMETTLKWAVKTLMREFEKMIKD